MKNTNSIKILLVGSNTIGSLENAYYRALQKIRVNNIEIFDVDKHKLFFKGSNIYHRILNIALMPLLVEQLRQRLIKFLSKRYFDVVIIFKGMEFSRETLNKCKSMKPDTLWINFNPDDPFNIKSRGSTNSYVMDSLSFYDVYLIWSKKLQQKIKKHGCKKVEYLPFGYDPDFHVPPREPVAKKPGVISFVGAWDKQREEILTAVSDHELKIYGKGWERVSRKSPLYTKIVSRNIYGEALSKVIYSSAVSLNLLRPQNYGAHNMRTFEIPAMGGLMLTTRSEEQNEFFPEEEASLMFNSTSELRKQLDRLIRSPDIGRRIQRCGFKLVNGNSYLDRAKMLLAMI